MILKKALRNRFLSYRTALIDNLSVEVYRLQYYYYYFLLLFYRGNLFRSNYNYATINFYLSSSQAVFGVLSSVEGCIAFGDVLKNTDIQRWYSDMKDHVQKTQPAIEA